MFRSVSTRWLAALAALLVFVLLAWLLAATLTLTSTERIVLVAGLVVLGLVAAGALLWYLRPRDLAAERLAHDREDALTAIAAARARMPRGAFDARPLVLVLGAEGSCKTTVVTRSGLDPELLAGDATAGQSEAPPATPAANLWLVRDAVIAEAGGKVFADAERWQRLVRALRAPRLAAALGRGGSAPRVAVVCVSADLFYAGAAGAQLDQLAQVTRERLAVAARELGVALPVYVLFTKIDRVPHFESWAAPFTREEVRSPVGAALPFDAAAVAVDGATRTRAAGTYAERLVPRVERAFAGIVSSLANRRIELLGRESVGDRRLDAYELPRELGKLAPAVSRFLAEICRPMQLGQSPQLRGFYFTGARPIVVGDAATAPPPSPAVRPPSPRATDATGVFAQPRVASAEAPSAYRAPATRRVPQWVFLDRLFPEVVLADAGAASVAKGGVRVAHLRRALLGAGIAAAVVGAIGVIGSWIGNRSLTERTRVAAAGVAALPEVTAPAGTIAFPSAPALRQLDALGVMLDTLRHYAVAGSPTRLHWGLWQGDALLDGARRVWLEGYRKQLHATAWAALVDSLRALPDAPRETDDYGRDYGMLKAYLITTSESPRSTSEFLAPVMLASWARGQTLDADVSALARRQFERYATELAVRNPWPQSADAGIVRRARDFLGRFAGGEQIYQYMLAQANKATKPAKLADLPTQAAGVVSAPAVVPGAFTAPGWRYMEDAFRNSDRFFEGEQWVVGDATAVQAKDRDQVIARIRSRYRDDYVEQWRSFARTTTVVHPGSAADAAQKLEVLSGGQSPLLAALSLIARNTTAAATDSSVDAAFQPVHAVTPGGATDKYVNDANQPYLNGLVSLYGALKQVIGMPPVIDTATANQRAQAGQQALGQATQAEVAARQLAQKFAVDTAASPVGRVVTALLLAPITDASNVLRGVAATRPPAPRRAPVVAAAPAPAPAAAAPAAGGGGAPPPIVAILNERGRAICADMTPMLAKFPFNPDATTEATVAEVNGLLAPGTGALFAFQQERLGDLLEKQGDKWVAKPANGVQLSQPFVAFFNRAAQVSAALYGGGNVPRVILHAHGEASPQVPTVNLYYGSQVAPFRVNTPPAQLVWPNPTGRDVRLTAQLGKQKEKTIAQAKGEWALFRLVAQAARVQGSGGTLHAEWNPPDRGAPPVAVEFTFANGAPVLQRGWLGGMSCAAQVTR